MWVPLVVTITLAAAVTALAARYLVVAFHSGSTPPQPTAVTRHLAVTLEKHIRTVASEPHNIEHPAALAAAADYIENELRSQGYTPLRQEFRVDGVAVRNIEVVLEPAAANAAQGTLIAGAHYDSAEDFPGANDNGSGVAALLEIANALKHRAVSRRVRLVFFVNEEQPYGKTPDMGSWRHAEALAARREAVFGMLALETIGYFSSRPGSQRFPFPFRLFYPNRGDFLAFVGLPGCSDFLHQTIGAFRSATPFPVAGCIAPAIVEGATLSDHWAYNQFGFPAAMVTDTAPFRNPFYHTPEDTPDTVDYLNLALVTEGLTGMIASLSGGGHDPR